MKFFSAVLLSLSVLTPLTTAHTGDSIEIRNKLSKYAVALDTKNFASLTDIFTTDATANLPLPQPTQLNGVQQIIGALTQSLGNLTTQHSITTTVVDFDGNNKANVIAYLIATYLGTGALTGKALSFYGTYTDQWVQQGNSWKIKNRNLVLSAPIGDVSIFTGQQRRTMSFMA